MSSPLIPSLDALRIELQALLQDLTQSGGGGQSFEQLLLQCFGSGYDRAKAATLRTAWSSGNGQQLPKLQLVSDGSLTGASAGFGATTNTIYLSTQFLLSASKQDRQAVLLEEIGHFIDYRINKTDTAGDEGALFSALARGIPLTATERAAIKAENDQAVVKINGISVAIEQALPSIFSPTTIRGSNLKTSGNLAAWSNQKGAFSTLSLYNDATGTTQIIASQAYGSQGFGNGNVALAGSSVVYAKFDGLDTEIYRYTLANGATPASTVKLTNNSFDDSAPQIQVVGSTTSIAWEGFDGVDVELFRNDNGVTRQLTNNSTDDQDLTLSGAVALWAGWDGNDWEIYSDNGSTTTKLTNNSTDDYSPVLDGNRVAWLGFNGTNENLFFNNGTTTTQITAGLVVEDPEISGNNLTYLTRSATDQLSLITRSISGATSKTLFTSPAAGSFYSSGNFSYEAAGNFIAWVEPGGSDSSGNLIDDKLKLYNATTGVSSTVSSKLANESFKLTPTELIYLEDIPGDGFFEGQLNAYNLTTGTKTQISATPPNGYPSSLDKAGNSYFAQGYYDITKYTPDATSPILSIAGTTVVEGLTAPQSAALTITLSQASSSNVSVSWKTQSYGDYISSLNQASDYSDYTRSSGIATFAPGQLSKTISVPILNDSYSEPDEVFYVQLSNPVGAALVPGQTFAEVVITDTLSAAVTTTLPADVENLLLTGSANINGTGNSTSNTITGNSGNNILDGGGGSFSSFTNYDIMIGGLGDDTYITSGFQATIQEQAGGGIDTVSSSYSFVSLGSFANVENLILTSLEFVSGSGSSEDNVITANNGNSNLDGQGGIDTASYASAASAVTVSLALPFTGQNTGGSGFDTLNNFENITGSNFNDSLTGSAIANVISGGLGADTLMGGDGNDTLIGGAGADVFRFDSTPNATTNRDSITGFSIAQGDKIQLENAVFTALTTPGTLAASAFLVGAAATNASQRILYNSTTGLLSYDLDGNGAGAAVPFATISTGIALTNSFFTVT